MKIVDNLIEHMFRRAQRVQRYNTGYSGEQPKVIDYCFYPFWHKLVVVNGIKDAEMTPQKKRFVPDDDSKTDYNKLIDALNSEYEKGPIKTKDDWNKLIDIWNEAKTDAPNKPTHHELTQERSENNTH